MTYKRPSKRARKAAESDIYSHLLHGHCLGCIIRPPCCDVTTEMLLEAWPKYRLPILKKWAAEGRAGNPWGWHAFENEDSP